jgi:four helix bundle protein
VKKQEPEEPMLEIEGPGQEARKKKISSFEDLFVFQEALALSNDIYRITREGQLAKDYGIADQMRRSAVSILSNIAEGFEREATAEFIRSLYFAKGSCGELRAQLMVAKTQNYVSISVDESLTIRCKKISAGIFQLIRQLRNRSKSL